MTYLSPHFDPKVPERSPYKLCMLIVRHLDSEDASFVLTTDSVLYHSDEWRSVRCSKRAKNITRLEVLEFLVHEIILPQVIDDLHLLDVKLELKSSIELIQELVGFLVTRIEVSTRA